MRGIPILYVIAAQFALAPPVMAQVAYDCSVETVCDSATACSAVDEPMVLLLGDDAALITLGLGAQMGFDRLVTRAPDRGPHLALAGVTLLDTAMLLNFNRDTLRLSVTEHSHDTAGFAMSFLANCTPAEG